MKKTLIVVDMQNDFINMALGTKEAVAILPKVKSKISEYVANGDEIIFTRDTHGEDYLETPEGKKLPVPHCIKGTVGWEIADGLYLIGDGSGICRGLSQSGAMGLYVADKIMEG